MGHARISINRQIKIYTKKCFRIFVNEKGWKVFISALIITSLIVCVTGDDMFLSYADTRNGSFALICGCLWIGIFNSIQSICKERDIIKREHRAGLSIRAYIIAHFNFEVVLCLIEALIVTLIVYLFNYSNIEFMGILFPTILELYITFFLTILSADALGMMVSSIVKTTSTAMTTMPFILIIQLVMSGVIFELEGISLFISKFTTSKWALNAICSIANVNSMSDAALIVSPYIDDYASTLENLALCLGVLSLFTIVCLIISIIFLSFVDKDKR